MRTHILLIVSSMLLAAACTPVPAQKAAHPRDIVENATKEPEELSHPVTQEFKEPAQSTSVPSLVAKEGLQEKFTRMAVDDLATRLNTQADRINVIFAEAIVWPDAALGCPLPDTVYAREKVPGFKIRLEVGGKIYVYHTDRTDKILLCPAHNPDEPGLR